MIPNGLFIPLIMIGAQYGRLMGIFIDSEIRSHTIAETYVYSGCILHYCSGKWTLYAYFGAFSKWEFCHQSNRSPHSETLFAIGKKFWKAYDMNFENFQKIYFHPTLPTPYPQNAVSGAFQEKIDPKGLWVTVTSRIMLRCISSCQKWIPDKILHRHDN